MTVVERITYLFNLAHKSGADTDWYGADKGTAEDFVHDVMSSGAAAMLEVLDLRAHDPRWELLRCYLQGLVDHELLAQEQAEFGLAELAAAVAPSCRNCSLCSPCPCDGCMAGGICDCDECTCNEERDAGYHDIEGDEETA